MQEEDREKILRRLSKISNKLLIRVPMITRDWVSVYKRNQGYEYRLDHTHHIEYDRAAFYQEMRNADLEIESLNVDFGEIYAVVVKKQ